MDPTVHIISRLVLPRAALKNGSLAYRHVVKLMGALIAPYRIHKTVSLAFVLDTECFVSLKIRLALIVLHSNCNDDAMCQLNATAATPKLTNGSLKAYNDICLPGRRFPSTPS